MISGPSSTVPEVTSTLGFVTKSTAPSSNARIAVWQPFSVREETMTTGIGLARISFSRNASPSIRGISTSKVSTSGCRLLIFSQAM